MINGPHLILGICSESIVNESIIHPFMNECINDWQKNCFDFKQYLMSSISKAMKLKMTPE